VNVYKVKNNDTIIISNKIVLKCKRRRRRI